MSKKYMLFVFDSFYPFGGIRDYVGHFDTAEEAFKVVCDSKVDVSGTNAELVNTSTMEVEKRWFAKLQHDLVHDKWTKTPWEEVT